MIELNVLNIKAESTAGVELDHCLRERYESGSPRTWTHSGQYDFKIISILFNGIGSLPLVRAYCPACRCLCVLMLLSPGVKFERHVRRIGTH